MIREEVNKISLNKNELTFSKEIAETLGIESAVILNLYKENSLDDISAMQGLLAVSYTHLTLPTILLV